MKKIYCVLCIFGVSLNGFSQWNIDPSVNNLVCSQSQDQQDARIVSDGAGGGIISWVDFRNDPNQNDADIFAQRVSATGSNLWQTNGVSVCSDIADQTAPVLISSGVNGTIIAWQDWRSGDRDIYAQYINAGGTPVWSANGVAVVAKTSHQSGPRIVTDGASGAVIVWEDSVNGNWDIYAQRINGLGAIQWDAGGVAICTASNSQVNPRIAVDGQGNIYITWQDKRNGQDYDIYAQKLNSSGVAQWAANGIVISNASNSQTNPKMAIDASGSPIISWQHTSSSNGYDVAAQRINASGIASWAANGISICGAAGNQSAIDLTTENLPEGAIITWKDGRSGNVNIYCQKVNVAGGLQWTTNGVLISNANRNQINPNIVGDGVGGGIIAWQDSVAGIWDAYSQRVSAAGSVMWALGGVPVGIATDNQTGVKNVSDGNGGAIYSFQDKRSGDFDIYAYKLESNGSVTAITNPIEAMGYNPIYPNPFNNTISIDLRGLGSDWKGSINILNLRGQSVLKQNISDSTNFINTDKLDVGVFLYQLLVQTNEGIQTYSSRIVKFP